MSCTPQDPRATAPAGPVAQLWAKVAAEWAIDFEPPQAVMVAVLPELAAMVEEVSGRLPDAQQRRWLAAALAALAHHVQAGTLPEVPHVPS